MQAELYADAKRQRVVNFPGGGIAGFCIRKLTQQRQVDEQDAQRRVLTEQCWTVGIAKLRNAQRRRALGTAMQPGRQSPRQCAAGFRRSSRAYQPGKGMRVIGTSGVGFIGINVHFEAHVR